MPTARTNGIEVYYEVHGAGQPVLLIGGVGADLRLFGELTGWLARRYQVVALDNRGAGRSDKPDAPYSIEMMAWDTLGLMDALSVPRAHLLGVSMGGRIALEMALSHPDRVGKLVLVSTSARGYGRPGTSLPTRAVRLLRSLVSPHGPGSQPRYAHDRQRLAALRYDATGRLGQVRAPALVLHGRDDRSVPLELALALHAGIRGAELEVFPGGHMFLVLAQRDRFLERVDAFLAG